MVAASSWGCVEDVELIDTGDRTAPADRSRSAELWANDPLRQTLDLTTGEFGRYVENGAIKNRNSQLGFGLPNPGLVEVGIQGRETGILLDLGPDAELATALGTSSGFVGLARRGDGGFTYGPANALFDHLAAIELGADGGDASRLVPAVGHVLVGAVVKRAGSAAAVDEALFVKILVVDHDPDAFLSIRWTVL